MPEKSHNLQDTFLNHVRKAKIPLTIFLVNGVKLQGVVTWFDNFCLLLRRDGHSQLVYKHAISTVMPSHPVQLFEPETKRRANGCHLVLRLEELDRMRRHDGGNRVLVDELRMTVAA